MRILVAALAAWSLIDAGAAAQSLADIARQEEARRKAVPVPGKVYTNDSLAKVPPTDPAAGGNAPSALPVSPSGAPAASSPATGGNAPGGSVAAETGLASEVGAASGTTQNGEAAAARDEASWRKRMTAARENLSRSQVFADALQSRINALTTDFTARDDPAQRAVIATDRQRALAELDRVKQETQQYQREITTIQEEARKAGVPAGWVR